MPFNLPDDREALNSVFSVFSDDRAALADLLLAVGKVFVFFFSFVRFLHGKRRAFLCAFHAAVLLLNEMRLVFAENAESYAAQIFTYISIARFNASCKGKAQTCPPMSCKCIVCTFCRV